MGLGSRLAISCRNQSALDSVGKYERASIISRVETSLSLEEIFRLAQRSRDLSTGTTARAVTHIHREEIGLIARIICKELKLVNLTRDKACEIDRGCVPRTISAPPSAFNQISDTIP